MVEGVPRQGPKYQRNDLVLMRSYSQSSTADKAERWHWGNRSRRPVAMMSIRFAYLVEGRDHVEVSHVHVRGGLAKSKYATVISLAHVVDDVYSAGHSKHQGCWKRL